MVYTSGSTGRPKGVAMPHRPTLNRFAWMWREFPFERDEVMCQKTALSFVDAVWEIFGPLLAGVPLVIIGNDVLLEPKAFLGALDRHGITRLLVVPSLLKTVVDADIDLMAAAPRLKMLFTSGERIPARLARAFRAKAPHVTLINLYGSSEVAADVTCEIVDKVDTDDVPIGRPIDNIRLYVLDASRNLVPPGQMGELHVGGEGLAAGYHGRPDLSAERFLPDPFSDADGARMFATGDLVHHLPDGRLVFRGRSDHQVKIRGSRVELGEVETALASQPGVAEAVAVARADDDGEMMLAAFITVQDGAKLGERDLRHALSQSLPGYTVPAQIRVLDQMPLNANGKIDRSALSDILAQIVPVETGPKPTTRTESEMLEIWRSTLKRGDIGPNDDFFDLGGYSLLAVKLFARIRRRFGVDMPISTLLGAPSAHLLAGEVEDRLHTSVQIDSGFSGAPEDSPWDTTAVIHPGPGTGATPLFIVGGVGGNVNNLYKLGKIVGRHRPLIGLQTRGIMGHRMHDTIEAIAADHITNMRNRQPEGPYLLAGYSGGVITAFEMARQLQPAGHSVAFLGLIDAAAPTFRVDISFSIRDRLAFKARMLRQHGVSHVLTNASLWIRNRIQPEFLVRIGEKLWPDKFRYEKIVKHWWRISPAYDPGPYDGDAWLYLTTSETDGYIVSKMREADPLYGWPALVRGKLKVNRHEADHLGLVSGDDVIDLAKHMEAEIVHILGGGG